MSHRYPLTSHVLDSSVGRPAKHMSVVLLRRSGDATWSCISQRLTNIDGRCEGLTTAEQFTVGVYKLRFETAEYFRQHGKTTFYPYVEIVFEVTDTSLHHHVPLLISPFGFTTYRGS